MTTLIPSTKSLNEQAMRRSVIANRSLETEGVPASSSFSQSLLFVVGQAGDEMEPWGRNLKRRDAQLRAFIPTENIFASALGTVVSRNAAFSWSLDGPERSAKKMHDLLENANEGEGWVDFVQKISMDLYTQDNGAFFEIVREGDNESAPVIGINHLDSWRCQHTGDRTIPVVYQDRLARYHKMPWYSVQTLSELPTPIESLYGQQICALSRLLRAAQILKNINQYKWEKTGGRHTRALHLVRGMSTQQINQALTQMGTMADNVGLTRFLQPLILGTVDPNVDLQTATLDFVGMPDGYSEEETFKQYINQIALALFEDYQTFAPLPGGNLGTGAQSIVLDAKGKGKGPALFRKIIATALNQKVLPRNLEFAWDEQDMEQEKKKAEAEGLRATNRATRITSGEITIPVAQMIAKDDGDLTDEYLQMMGEDDLTDDVQLSDDAQPDTQIGDQQGTTAADDAPAVPTPAQVDSLIAGTRELVFPHLFRGVAEGEKTRLGEFLQTRIHRAFTTAADDLAALGYMDTEGRIKLSSIIGDSLRTFSQLADSEAGDIASLNLLDSDVRELLEHHKELQLRAGGPQVDDTRLALEREVVDKIGPAILRIQSTIRERLEEPEASVKSRGWRRGRKAAATLGDGEISIRLPEMDYERLADTMAERMPRPDTEGPRLVAKALGGIKQILSRNPQVVTVPQPVIVDRDVVREVLVPTYIDKPVIVPQDRVVQLPAPEPAPMPTIVTKDVIRDSNGDITQVIERWG